MPQRALADEVPGMTVLPLHWRTSEPAQRRLASALAFPVLFLGLLACLLGYGYAGLAVLRAVAGWLT